IGITGPPGVGKSTLLGRLISGFRARGKRVAVLAVDPQSPISGGALLGDRLRMAEAAAGDDDVFIRSLSSRGVAGGLSASVRWISRLLERFGYDVVLVETIGVGQAELAVLRVADVVMLMVMPGTGDGVQWEKAGLIEVAHLVVINKADHPGVDRIEQELRDALEPNPGSGDPARVGPRRVVPPILRTVASTGDGVAAVVEQLDGMLADRPAADWHQVRTELLQEAEMLLGQRLQEIADSDPRVSDLARAVAAGTLDLSSAAEDTLRQLLAKLTSSGT
ncbi:MAG: GTP-binding protein, partial [Phycisphaerae bacterium]|nr:GTP-binding protein [Phycisphaerae bacterium]